MIKDYKLCSLEEVLSNLRDVVERYQNVPLIETYDLSKILRDLGCNLSYLVGLRKHYYKKFQFVIQQSKGTSNAAKIKEASGQFQN